MSATLPILNCINDPRFLVDKFCLGQFNIKFAFFHYWSWVLKIKLWQELWHIQAANYFATYQSYALTHCFLSCLLIVLESFWNWSCCKHKLMISYPFCILVVWVGCLFFYVYSWYTSFALVCIFTMPWVADFESLISHFMEINHNVPIKINVGVKSMKTFSRWLFE